MQQFLQLPSALLLRLWAVYPIYCTAAWSSLNEGPVVEVAEEGLAVPEPAQKRAKRAWKAVPQPFKDWLLDYRAHMWMHEWGGTPSACSTTPKKLSPEIFWHLQPGTVWRWKHSRDLPEWKKARRNHKIPPAAQTVLIDMARNLSKDVAMHSGALKELFNKRLIEMGILHTVSRAGVRRLLRRSDFSYQRRTKKDARNHTPLQRSSNTTWLRRRLQWTQAEHFIPDKFIYNIDETSLRFLSMGGEG
eukprot:4354280-Amphidinium_carterae.1